MPACFLPGKSSYLWFKCYIGCCICFLIKQKKSTNLASFVLYYKCHPKNWMRAMDFLNTSIPHIRFIIITFSRLQNAKISAHQNLYHPHASINRFLHIHCNTFSKKSVRVTTLMWSSRNIHILLTWRPQADINKCNSSQWWFIWENTRQQINNIVDIQYLWNVGS